MAQLTGVSQEEAIALIKRGYEAFSTGDMDTLRNVLFDPDIVWHSPGRNPLAGDYKGVDNVLGFFMKLMEATGGTFKVELHDVLASDEHVVALAKSSGTRNGKTLIADYAHVCHMKDGKLTEAWIINVDPYAGDEFLS